MQAIRTRYLPPTDTKGARISATTSHKRVMIPFDQSLDTPKAHRKAAQALCDRLKWNYDLIGGCYKDDYYWTLAPYWRNKSVKA